MKELYSFKDDYSEGAHPRILKAIQTYNLGQTDGYGNDRYCEEATRLIRENIDHPNAAIHFTSGGTQANMLVLSSLIRPYESVIAVDSAHIAVHETGSIEATGHKINIVPSPDGKLTPEEIHKVVIQHRDEHSVKPRIVFISQTTELGTIYTKKELTAISQYCRKNNLYLYLDGARIAVALTSDKNDLTLSEVVSLVDALYIGGTKNGCLLGEAVIFPNPELQPHFRFVMKQKGALLAKGRLFGIQFTELFTNDLFFDLGRHSNRSARKLANGIKNAGYTFKTPPESNQLFPVLPDGLIKKLQKNFHFHIWEKTMSQHSVIRLVTSWATPEVAVENLLNEF